jgi:uracil DNA glycosylase
MSIQTQPVVLPMDTSSIPDIENVDSLAAKTSVENESCLETKAADSTIASDESCPQTKAADSTISVDESCPQTKAADSVTCGDGGLLGTENPSAEEVVSPSVDSNVDVSAGVVGATGAGRMLYVRSIITGRMPDIIASSSLYTVQLMGGVPGWEQLFITAGRSGILNFLQHALEENERRAILSGSILIPAPKLIFEGLRRTSMNKVKVVIVGQDPYPGKFPSDGTLHACGVPFAISKLKADLDVGPKSASGRKIPTLRSKSAATSTAAATPGSKLDFVPGSLKNILTEAGGQHGKASTDYDLRHWSDQGVLLLNSSLTLYPESSQNPNIWTPFICTLLRMLTTINRKIVYVLVGKSAKYYDSVLSDALSMEFPVLVMHTAHPSNRNANGKGFVGSGVFTNVNLLLRAMGEVPIDW